jgi:hypothetical protein
MDTVVFENRVGLFVEALNERAVEYNEEDRKEYGNNFAPDLYRVGGGRKYLRIEVLSMGLEGHRSVYAFINTENGDILKPASWKAPAKHARGNVFADDLGLSCCGRYGVAYLR